MRKTFVATLALGLLAGCSTMSHLAQPKVATVTTSRLTLLPQEALVPGKPVTIEAKLNGIADRTLLTAADLDTVHTQKFHLLVIDPTLTDYQHIHPEPTNTPGIWRFTFTPKTAAGYRAWADITPSLTHQQEFAMAELGGQRPGAINKTETRQATVGGYHFLLSFDEPLKAGEASMGTIRITDAAGQPVQALAPVMGAFAHIVGFYDDYRTVLHTHPMGDEPKNATDRGGPEIMFHLEPRKAGFIKLFAQVNINGHEIYAPFGVKVSAH